MSAYGTGQDETRSVAVGDVNGDGIPDVIAGNIGQLNAVYFGNAERTFSSSATFGEPQSRTYAVAVADLDRDGDLDVVAANVGARNVAFFNQGQGARFVAQPFGQPNAGQLWPVRRVVA